MRDQTTLAAASFQLQCAAVLSGHEQVGAACKCAEALDHAAAPLMHSLGAREQPGRAARVCRCRPDRSPPLPPHCRHTACSAPLLPPVGCSAPLNHSRLSCAGWAAPSAQHRHWRAPPLPPGAGSEPCRRAWRPCWPLHLPLRCWQASEGLNASLGCTRLLLLSTHFTQQWACPCHVRWPAGMGSGSGGAGGCTCNAWWPAASLPAPVHSVHTRRCHKRQGAGPAALRP